MSAQPKNKITRVEQGKRRRGNTPKLQRDPKTHSVPLYKRGFFDKIMKKIGSSSSGETKESKKTKSHQAAGNPTAKTTAPKMATMSAPVKKARSTQHKGG